MRNFQYEETHSDQKIEEITADELLETANEIFIPDRFSTLIYAKQHI